ncbi:hypothetical protein MMPV_004867 [Pyropia vietnamensis]
MAPTTLTTLAAAIILSATVAASACMAAPTAASTGGGTSSPFLVGTTAGTSSIASPWSGIGAVAAGAPAAVAAVAFRRATMADPPPLRSAIGRQPRRTVKVARSASRARGGAENSDFSPMSRQSMLPPKMLPGGRSIHVNCGGSFTVYNGATWIPDTADEEGVPDNSPTYGRPGAENLPVLLRTNRFSKEPMTYVRRVPVASLYRVTLHWAEIFVPGPNIRIMDVFVAIDGQQPVTLAIGLDVYSRAGNATPYSLSYPPLDADAIAIKDTVAIYLQPTFYNGLGENPFLSAFEVAEETPTPTPTPDVAAEIDPAKIGELLREAEAIADVTIPASVAAAGYLTEKAAAVAEADAAITEARRLKSAADEGSSSTEADPLIVAAYDAVKEANEEVNTAAADFTGEEFRLADVSVTAELTALRESAANLNPSVCAYLTGVKGTVSITQIDALDQRVTYVELAVMRLMRQLADDRAAVAAIREAVDRLVGRVETLRGLVANRVTPPRSGGGGGGGGDGGGRGSGDSGGDGPR